MSVEYFCSDCGYKLVEDERPCPKCGCNAIKICVELHDKLSISDKLKNHLKSGEKRSDGKPIKEIISKIKNGNERRMIRDRRGENTQATFTVWRDGNLHHIHDKTSNRIEIWQKEGSIYRDKEGNLYSRITSKKDNLTEVFVDSDGKEYRFLTR